jgi:alpha-tubulin suppressor-like RCC1 family protein
MHRQFVSTRFMVAVLSLVACSPSEPSGPPAPPPPPAPAPQVATRLAFVSAPTAEEQQLPFSAPPVVELLDASGARVTGSSAAVTLTLNATRAGAQLAGTRVVTAVNGLATFPGLSVDSAGNGFSLTASSGTLATATSAPFIIRIMQLELQVVSGNAQSGTAGAALAQPIRIRVTRVPGGATQAGRRIQFVAQGGGSIAPAEATSDANGIVQVIWTLGSAGEQLGQARALESAGGSVERVEFTATVAGSTLALTAVSSGGASSCGMQVGGQVVCWGLDTFGQLGDGDGSNPPNFAARPVRVPSPPALTQVSVGAEHACGLTGDGVAFCWGNPNTGRLGIGPINATPRRSPLAVSTALRFTQISSGSDHSCALDADGAAYCWGSNAVGQVGDGQGGGGPGTNVLTPVAVAGGLRFVSITAGQAFTCALTGSGRVFCWGNNSSGQLGDGTRLVRLEPVPVALPTGTRVTSLDAGSSHACVVLDDLRAFCWGLNSLGALGNGGNSGFATTPVAVSGNLQFRFISAGANHSCALTTGNSAVCWGNNSTAQLGNGTDQVLAVPTPSPVSGGLSFETISAGGSGTCAIERSTARALCWGSVANGQVGNGAFVSGTERTPVSVLAP